MATQPLCNPLAAYSACVTDAMSGEVSVRVGAGSPPGPMPTALPPKRSCQQGGGVVSGADAGSPPPLGIEASGPVGDRTVAPHLSTGRALCWCSDPATRAVPAVHPGSRHCCSHENQPIREEGEAHGARH
eukprot:gene23362-biopygen22306